MTAMPSTAITFDTHALVKRLVQAGASQTLAEAIVETVQPATVTPDISHLATKDDLKPLATREDLAKANADVIRWLFGGIGILIISIVTEHFLK